MKSCPEKAKVTKNHGTMEMSMYAVISRDASCSFDSKEKNFEDFP